MVVVREEECVMTKNPPLHEIRSGKLAETVVVRARDESQVGKSHPGSQKRWQLWGWVLECSL